MMQANRIAKSILVLSVLALLLAGCFGGGASPSKPKPPTPTPFTLQGTVSGPSPLASATAETTTIPSTTPLAAQMAARPLNATATIGAGTAQTQFDLVHAFVAFVNGPRVLAAATSLSGESPLANVPVNAYNLAEFLANPNAPVLAHTTTESDGTYKLAITHTAAGTDLLVVVGTDPRLSAIVPDAGKKTTVAAINSATTLAAELWAYMVLQDGTPVTFAPLQQTVDTAWDALEQMQLNGDRLLTALIDLIPPKFGIGLPAVPHPNWAWLVDALMATIPWGPIECRNLALDVHSGLPGTTLALRGMPSDWSDEHTFAKLQIRGDAHSWSPAYIELVGGDAAELVMPIHPIDAMNGGEGELIVYNDAKNIYCQPIAVHVEPLTPAPGTLASIVDELKTAFSERADAFGYDAPTLQRATPADIEALPEHVKGLAIGLQLINGNVPNSLRSVLEGNDLMVNGVAHPVDSETLDLTDALLAASRFGGLLQSSLADFASAESRSGSSNPAPIPLAARTIMPMQGGIAAPNNITTPEQLSYWMGIQARCADINSGWAGELMTVGGLAIGALAFVPGAQAAAGIAGLGMALLQINIDMCEKLLPSQFAGMDLTVGPQTFNEDSEDIGTWTAYLNVSRGAWTLNWPTAVGLIPGAGKLAQVIGKVSRQATAVIGFGETLAGWMQGMLTTAWGATERSGPLTLAGVAVAPIKVEPTREGERAYFNWYLHPSAGSPFEFTADETGYVPREAGEALFKVDTVTRAFQGQYATAEADLEVKAIEMAIVEAVGQASSPFFVKPSAEMGLLARVENADDKTVRWFADAGSIIKLPEPETGQIAIYRAPSTSGRYWIKAESMTRTGPRADNTPPRIAEALVVVGELAVWPQPGCVEVGDTFQFTASIGDEPVAFSDLIAEVSGPGRLGPDGTFSATGAGAVTIRVWHPDYEGVDEVAISFEVKQNCSGFTVNASGDVSFTHIGVCTGYIDLEAGKYLHVTLGSFLNDPVYVNFFMTYDQLNVGFAQLRNGAVDSIVQAFTRDESEGVGSIKHPSFPNPNIGVPLFGTLTLQGSTDDAGFFRLYGTFNGEAVWPEYDASAGEPVDKSARVFINFHGVAPGQMGPGGSPDFCS